MKGIRSFTVLALLAGPLASQQPAKPDTGERHRMMGPGMMPQRARVDRWASAMMGHH